VGDRSNVFIQQRKEGNHWTGIGLYSHWGGLEMHANAIKAAQDSVSRLGDPEYFTRRVIHKVLNMQDPDAGETGHGLWVGEMPDNEYPILVINAESGAAWYVLPDGMTYLDDATEGTIDVRRGTPPKLPEGWDE
jgi:hypothetical protein